MVKQTEGVFMKAALPRNVLGFCLILLCQLFLACERETQMTPPNDELKTTSKLDVANSGSNTISVIDANCDEVIRTIAVGRQPSALTFSSSRKQLYVSNFISKNISSVDVLTDTKLADFELRGLPLKSKAYSQNRLLVLIQRDTINYWCRPIMVMDLDTKAIIDSLELSNACAYLNAFAITSDGKLFGAGFHGASCDFIPTTPLIYGVTVKKILGYMTLEGTDLIISPNEMKLCIVGKRHSTYIFDIEKSEYAKVGGNPGLGGYDSLKGAAFSTAKQKLYLSEPKLHSVLVVNSSSSSSAIITYNFISGHMENSLWYGYSSIAQVHRNTIKNNDLVGIWLTSNSSVTAYGAGITNGRNEIRLNGEGIFSDQSSPIFGKDVTNQWGNNWIQDNAGYEAHDNGFGYLLRAERCYWGGQQTNIYGNVDVTPYLTSLPNPVGWGQSDGYDPSYIVKANPDDADVEVISMGVDNNLPLTSASSDGALFSNSPNNLNTAIAKGIATGDWSEASELITLLHLDLQNGLAPNVEFAAAEGYANNPQVASFIRKALALLLVEKDRLDKNLNAALAKLEAFGKSNAEHKAELLANAGLLHLYQQNDLPAAQKVLDELKAMAANGDSSAVTHVKMLGVLLDDDQRLVVGGNTNFNELIIRRPSPLNQSNVSTFTQNYPNPFNPSTTIRFHLNQNERVRLLIYDVAGQLTRVLADGEFVAGDHTITWNSRNQNGIAVASGVYFYELVVGKNVERKKMTLMG